MKTRASFLFETLLTVRIFSARASNLIPGLFSLMKLKVLKIIATSFIHNRWFQKHCGWKKQYRKVIAYFSFLPVLQNLISFPPMFPFLPASSIFSPNIKQKRAQNLYLSVCYSVQLTHPWLDSSFSLFFWGSRRRQVSRSLFCFEQGWQT